MNSNKEVNKEVNNDVNIEIKEDTNNVNIADKEIKNENMVFVNALNKHEFGYLLKQFKKMLIRTSIQFGVSIILLVIGLIIYKTKKNIFTLVSVLGLLPAGQSLVNLIMLIKSKKHTCPESLYNEIMDSKIDKDSPRPQIGFDYYITSYDVQFPVQSITVINDSLIGYTNFDKFNHKQFEKHIKNMLSQNSLNISVIKIFEQNELDKYTERISSYSSGDNVQTEKELKILSLMGSLSL